MARIRLIIALILILINPDASCDVTNPNRMYQPVDDAARHDVIRQEVNDYDNDDAINSDEFYGEDDYESNEDFVLESPPYGVGDTPAGIASNIPSEAVAAQVPARVPAVEEGNAGDNILDQASRSSLSRGDNVSVTETNDIEDRLEELKAIYWLKEEILFQLGLEEAPNVTLTLDEIPTPMREEAVREADENYQRDQEHQSHTGKLHSQALHGTAVSHSRYSLPFPTQQFTFQLKNDIAIDGVDSVELWFYKLNTTDNPLMNHTFELSLVKRSARLKNGGLITSQECESQSGWIQFDIKHNVLRWLHHNQLNRILQISCKTCPPINRPNNNVTDELVESTGSNKPFIYIKYKQFHRNHRRKRSFDCVGRAIRCCGESFTFNFADNGFGFIGQPKEITMYRCKGTCYRTSHRRREGVITPRVGDVIAELHELDTCCTPTAHAPVSLLYFDADGVYKHTIVQNVIPTECGCR